MVSRWNPDKLYKYQHILLIVKTIKLFEISKYHLLLISSTFYKQLLRRYSLPKNYKANLQLEKSCTKQLVYEKGARKMLMKLSPGIDNNTAAAAVVVVVVDVVVVVRAECSDFHQLISREIAILKLIIVGDRFNVS